jgi:hypothetical protein
MDTIDKINFIFNAYDFEHSQSLLFDEVTLLFRSCLKGNVNVPFFDHKLSDSPHYGDEIVYSNLTNRMRLIRGLLCLGLSKVCNKQALITSTTNVDAENYANFLFNSVNPNLNTTWKPNEDRRGLKITNSHFLSFCLSHPIVSSWLNMLARIPPHSSA